MKKIIFNLVVLILFFNSNISATNLWQGTTVMPSSWGTSVSIASSKFASAQIGDTIIISITSVTSGGTLQLNNGSSVILTGTGAVTLTTTTQNSKFIITSGMLSDLQSTGLVVAGIKYTLTSVDLSTGPGPAGLENAVWLGNVVTGSYTNYQVLKASCFKNAQVGYWLRIKIKDVLSGAQGHLVNGSWGVLTDASTYVQLSGVYFQFKITSALLTLLQSNGCIVSGSNYTLTGVYVIDPATLPLPLTSTVQQTNNWVWYDPDKPQINIDIQNTNATTVNATAVLNVTTDKYESVTSMSKTLSLASGTSQTATFNLGLTNPGFYRCTAIVNDSAIKTFNIGFNPTSIVSANDAQSDFKAFWDKARTDLAAVQPNYKLTLQADKSNSVRNIYLVEMNSVGDSTANPVVIRGYYAEPVAAGKYPAIITYLGYDSDTTVVPSSMSASSNPGYVELRLSCRGQMLNRYLAKNPYGDWVVYGLGNKDNYYYRGAYMDVVRGIDFIASRDKVQTNNIFAQGSSQGGAFTLAAVSLDTRIKAAAVGISFMGDFPDYFKVGAWPRTPLTKKSKAIGLSESDTFTMLSYFDTKNLAQWITCPIIMTSSLQDPVCPPHTNFAPYNNLVNVPASDKQYSINPLNLHAMPSNWSTTYMNFFAKYLTSTGVENKFANQLKYSVQGKLLKLDGISVGSNLTIYDVVGKKIQSVICHSSVDFVKFENSGIYLVCIQNNLQNYGFKIAIN